MRTTVTLATDVAAALDELRRQDGRGMSEVVNDLVRQGLARRSDRPPFRQTTSDMGVPLMPLDDIAGVLDALEGDDRRS